MDNSWMNNPAFKDINPQKLLLLNQLLGQANSKSKEELIPFFIAASSKASSMGMSFNDDETDVIISVLTANMSEQDKSRVETIRKLSKMLSQRQTKK
ncbi:MAG: hypothetical protein HFG39_04295 [Lachnospiraceae bacterium]|nr:hypothetical protein [Lachnospiraceae bacterium]